jgi:hypothetical protein
MSSRRGTGGVCVLLVLGAACILSLAVAGCRSKSDEAKDKKIAELEQRLQASKAQGTAAAEQKAEPAATSPAAVPTETPGAGAARPAAGATQAAKPAAAKSPTAKPPAGVSAEQYAKDKAAASDQYAKDKSTVKDFADKQRDTNAQVQRQIEDLKPIEVTLPVGTVIAARPSKDLSTDKLKDGSTFEALLEQDLVVGGTLIARKGAHVTGVVVTSDPGGRVKGVASLLVTARALEGPKGTTIRLHTDNYSTQADTSKGKDAARTGIMAGAGAVIGAIAGGGKGAAIGAGAGAAAGVGTNLATHGKAAVIPAETLIEFKLTDAVTVVVPR